MLGIKRAISGICFLIVASSVPATAQDLPLAAFLEHLKGAASRKIATAFISASRFAIST